MRLIYPNAAGPLARRFFKHLPAGGTRPPAGFSGHTAINQVICAIGSESGFGTEPRAPVLKARPEAALHLLLALLLCAASPLRAFENSERAPLAAKTLLTAGARAGSQLVAVGDRGHVLLSSDQGRTWKQVIVPTRALLTGVAFPDERHGWAVGHDGVILATQDGGQTWARQDDGKDLNAVYLDVLFLDAQRGLVVGAYGKCKLTTDGGRTWTSTRPSKDEVHCNRITASADGYLYIAGESGLLLVSRDRGETWRKANIPYEGSLFGALPLAGGKVIVHGLRGHILRSDDHGGTWSEEDNPVEVLIMGSAQIGPDAIVLGGQGGNLFVSRDQGATFKHWQPTDFGTSIAAVLDAGDGVVLALGEAGATRITLP